MPLFVQQSTVDNQPAGTPPNPALPGNSTKGNLVIAVVVNGGIRTASVVGMGASWTTLVEGTTLSGGVRVHIFGAIVVTPATTLTFTVDAGSASNAQIIEFSGVGVITDGTNSLNSTSAATTSIQPGNITTANPNDLVIAVAGTSNGGGSHAITGPGAPWNALNGLTPANGIFNSAATYQIVTTTGSFNPTFTWSNPGSSQGAAIVALQATDVIGSLTPAPPITQVVAAFSQRPLRLVGTWDATVVSAAQPVGYAAPPAVPIRNIIANFTPPQPIPWWSAGWNSSAPIIVPQGYPTTGPPAIAQIVANFSPWLRPIPWYAADFNSSVPLVFPTPPAPNVPQIIVNFSPWLRPIPFYSDSWSLSVPLAFFTGPPPPIALILSNWSPWLRPIPWYSADFNSSFPQAFTVTPPPPHLAQILMNFRTWNVIPPFQPGFVYVPVPQTLVIINT